MTYRPRTAPARFFEGAPEIVRRCILVIHGPFKDSVCEFDVLFKLATEPSLDGAEIVGLDFDAHGAQGCHFFLSPAECRGYRDRNRRKRVAWVDLPEPTRRAIITYLES